MIRKPPLSFWKAVLALTIIFTFASMLQMVGVARSYGIDILHSTWIFLLAAAAGLLILAISLLILLFTRGKDHLLALPETITRLPGGWKIAAILIAAVVLPIYSLATLHPFVGRFYAAGVWTHLSLFWWSCLGLMVCIRIIRKDSTWFTALWLGALLSAVFYVVTRQFLKVTDYPFALTWSEASRFYGASLVFAKRIYGERVPFGIMHATWHFLISVPFLFGNLPIWLHRLWSALLQLVLGVGVSWTLARRLRLGDRSRTLVTAGWIFIFLFPLPVLVHLQLCTLLIMWGVRPKETWRTVAIVGLASIWAGLSRINWFPIPGIFAAVLYLLEVPYQESPNLPKYFWKPVLWILGGTLVAFASNVIFMQVSGNGAGVSFTSSLASDLLWYRLLPNATYRDGILPDLLLLAGPVIAAIVLSLSSRTGVPPVFAFPGGQARAPRTVRHGRYALHPLRLAGILAALVVLLIGGLAVSVKIGGGSDLHNLDAFLILLVTVGTYFFFGSQAPEQVGIKLAAWRNPILLSLLLITPIWMILRVNARIFTWDKAEAGRTLALIRQTVEERSRQGEQVLFISQRQLLSLKMVEVTLVPDYEQDFLMEMVMSHNRGYLDAFQNDLRTHRFAAIVLEAQTPHYFGRTRAFGEENDYWVQEVTLPLLCYYEPLGEFDGLSTVVYVPRSQVCR